MKLENQTVLGSQTSHRKSYNPFDSDDEDTNGFTRSNINGYDIKSFETNADSLTFHLDDGNLSWEEAILGNFPILSQIPVDSNGEEVILRKDTELFTDKTVTECELPELVVCYKENGYHSVKDIGIDEGMPAREKFWIKNKDDHGNTNLYDFLALTGDTNGHLDIGNKHQGLSFINELKSTSENDLEKDTSVEHQGLPLVEDAIQEKQHSASERGIDESTKMDEFKHNSCKKESDSSLGSIRDEIRTDDGVYVTMDHQLSEREELNYGNLEKRGNEVSEEEHVEDDVSLESTEEEFPTRPFTTNVTEDQTKSSKNQSEEATSPQSIELPTSQEISGSKVLAYNSKVELGSIILDFNSTSSTISDYKKEEAEISPRQIEEKPPETQTMSRHDDDVSNSITTVSNTDNNKQRFHGETSFSAVMQPPSSITYMGPIPHSGNISLRSESSAGSTRSFAFPVLQAEWNSSPVRMAKADQKHCRKHRGWVHSLMCCKF